MAQQCNRSAERRRLGMYSSATEKVAVVETLSLQCFQRVWVVKRIQFFTWIIVCVEFMKLSGSNASGHSANSQILLACILKVFWMVYFDMSKSPAV